MERKIGEKFTLRGKTYITVEGKECDGCAFEDFRICLLTPSKTRTMGACSHYERKDSTSVIFKEVHGSDFDIDDKPIKPNNMKPFNLEQAKAGKPVCTRDGRNARILCSDLNTQDERCVVAAVDVGEQEDVLFYYKDGKHLGEAESRNDLFIKTYNTTVERFVNLYEGEYSWQVSVGGVYSTEEEARRCINDISRYIKTIKF